MNMSKKINVNFSSLVGLKAELLRKQTEVKAARIKAENAYVAPTLKRKMKKLKDEKVEAKMIDVEDVNAHKKSKLMLEAKARLYERLKKSRNGSENFLVDFTNKSDESDDEKPIEADYDDEHVDPDENWVEYEDCFGRTRKCLRKDLPIMKEKDELVKRQVMKNRLDGNDERSTGDFNSPEPEKEPEIEIMRRKWEEQTQKLAEKVNIHYQDILFDEARSHGVGYYAFAQDEEERAKQQENLVKLRKETEQKQKEMKELKELRDKMEQNRLKAARIRQRIRAGLPAEPTEEELAQENDNSIGARDSNKEEETFNKIDDKCVDKEKTNIGSNEDGSMEEDPKAREDKIKAFEEILDRRPRWRQMSQEEWVYTRRQDRKEEFAPLYNNFKSAGLLHNIQSDNANSISQENNLSDLSYRLNDKSVDDTKQLGQDNSTIDKLEQLDNDSIDDSEVIGPLPPSEIDSEVIGPLPPTEIYSDNKECRNQNKDENLKSNAVIDRDVFGNSNNLMTVTTLPTKMNEESIAAGLRYLRQKFEQKYH